MSSPSARRKSPRCTAPPRLWTRPFSLLTAACWQPFTSSSSGLCLCRYVNFQIGRNSQMNQQWKLIYEPRVEVCSPCLGMLSEAPGLFLAAYVALWSRDPPRPSTRRRRRVILGGRDKEVPNDPNSISNGPSGGQIMLIAKRLKNYTGYVTTKSRDRGVATSPPRSIICNTVQYRTSTIINLAISTSDCGTSTRTIVSLYVSDLSNVTKSTVLVRTRGTRGTREDPP